MAKVKSLYMDSLDKFYGEAEVIIEDCETIEEAKEKVEVLRKEKFNWLDRFTIYNEVELYWYA
jgi:hypothetical protein